MCFSGKFERREWLRWTGPLLWTNTKSLWFGWTLLGLFLFLLLWILLPESGSLAFIHKHTQTELLFKRRKNWSWCLEKKKKKKTLIFSLILLHIAKFRCRAFLSCSLILIWIIVDLFGDHSSAIFHKLFLNFLSARNWFFQQHGTSIFNPEFPLLSFLEKLS